MKKFFTSLMVMAAMVSATANAQEFNVLTDANDVLAHSTENVQGAKDVLRGVLASGTDEEITAALQEYQKNATPDEGYAFDMTFQLIHPSVSESITKAELAKGWACDVEGVTDIAYNKSEKAGSYLRVNDKTKFMEDEALGKYMLYQKPVLNSGKYFVQVQAYAQSNGKVVTLSAGETDGPLIASASVLSDYSLEFDVAESGETKIGAKRNMAKDFDWTKSKITLVAFNNMKLYKLASVAAGIAVVETAACGNTVDVYSIDGKMLKHGVSRADAANGLGKGIYIIGGKKVIL